MTTVGPNYKPGLNKFQRINEQGETEYGDAYDCWMDERDVCQHCLEECTAEEKPYRWGERQTSFGYYAGRYCDACWPKSGYRDATDPDAEFSELDAGESLHGEPDF